MIAAGMTDVGRMRPTNQDQYLIDAGLGVYAVADGMGGHAAGEVAAGLAIEALARSMRESGGAHAPTVEHAVDRLTAALNAGNRRICETVIERTEWRGMGTTMVVLLRLGDRALIANVGDSRAYLFRDGALRQLTSDHSWVNEQVKLGLLDQRLAQRHPMRNIVTRALGNQAAVEVDVTEEQVLPGDMFILCSDGLNGMLTDEEIEEELAGHRAAPRAACRALIERANARGGADNITVIVLFSPEGEGTAK
jgi:protein phosphatase